MPKWYNVYEANPYIIVRRVLKIVYEKGKIELHSISDECSKFLYSSSVHTYHKKNKSCTRQ